MIQHQKLLFCAFAGWLFCISRRLYLVLGFWLPCALILKWVAMKDWHGHVDMLSHLKWNLISCQQRPKIFGSHFFLKKNPSLEYMAFVEPTNEMYSSTFKKHILKTDGFLGHMVRPRKIHSSARIYECLRLQGK